MAVRAVARAGNVGVAVVMPVDFPQHAGAERQLQTLLGPLGRHSIRLTIIARRAAGQAAWERIDGAMVLRPCVLPGRILGSLSMTIASLLLLVRWRRRVDVVHAYSPFSPLTVGVLAKMLLGRPLALKILGGGPTGELARLRATREAGLRFQMLRHAVDRIVAVSDEIAEHLSAAGVQPDRIIRIPNGVDTTHYRPPEQGWRAEERVWLGCSSRPVAVYVGRLEPEKGVDILLEAWAAVRETVPGALLLVVGDGRRRREYETRAVAAVGGADGDVVRFVGAVDDPRPYFWAADCFVLPSRAEGLSNALLEAMATGLSCVATDVGASAAALQGDQCGWVVPPNDPAALAVALVAALTDDDARQQRGAAARARAIRDFSIEATADQLAALYRHLAAARA